jgi:hypothetical protein
MDLVGRERDQKFKLGHLTASSFAAELSPRVLHFHCVGVYLGFHDKLRTWTTCTCRGKPH